MQTDNRLFDDFARMAGGALNALTGIKTEIEALMRQQMEHFLGNMNLVTREEFDVMQSMLANARNEQETLAARLAVLEAELATLKEGAGAVPLAKRGRKIKDEGEEA